MRRAACVIACAVLSIAACVSSGSSGSSAPPGSSTPSTPSTSSRPSTPPAPSTSASGGGGDSHPAWLEGLIAKIQKQPVTNPPTAIYRYAYRGSTVYYRTSRCCDIRSVVYDRDGAAVCEPDGGIVAKTDPRCPDFFETRSEKRLVFQDPR